jgi:hypothetical protein
MVFGGENAESYHDEGLTAMMSSLARIPHEKAAGSSSAIIEIDPLLVHDEDVFADILAAATKLLLNRPPKARS